jgi:hypothetical protein
MTPNVAMIFINVIFAVLTVVILYRLAMKLFGRAVALAGWVLLFAFIPVFLVLWSGGSDIYGGGLSRDIPSISSLSICHLRKQIAHKGTYRPCAIDQHLYHRIDLPSSSRDEIHQLFEFSFLIITALLHYRVSTFNL